MARNHVLFLIAQQGFDDEELLALRRVLRARGAVARVAAPSAGDAVGAHGARVHADLALADARVPDFDALVVVGGPGAMSDLWGRREAMQLAAGFVLERKPVAGIGHGAVLPAQAELLAYRDATCAPDAAAAAEMRKHNAVLVAPSVVEADNGVITAAGADASEEVAHLVAERLGLPAEAGIEAPT